MPSTLVIRIPWWRLAVYQAVLAATCPLLPRPMQAAAIVAMAEWAARGMRVVREA